MSRKYLELFKEGFPPNMSDKTAIEKWPYVGYDVNGGVVYTVVPAKEEEPEIDLTIPYVTFTAEEDNSSVGLARLSTNQTLEYSTDTITWNTFEATTNIPLNNGDKVYVRGILSADNNLSNYTNFKMNGKIAASGNCNALWNYEDLNAALKNYCGYNMFHGCTSLTTAPELPATTLSNYCYRHMFSSCSSLTTAPELPATTLAIYCYYEMFMYCTSLTTVPEELPATTLSNYCYQSMFSGCKLLAAAPELPATTLANSCYYNMFNDCTSLTTAPELPATTLANSCYFYMFHGCTSLTTAPELPATELINKCYFYMFNGCTSLNYIKCLATYMPYSNCTQYWMGSTSSTGTFVKHPDMTSWKSGASGIPSGWTVVDDVV